MRQTREMNLLDLCILYSVFFYFFRKLNASFRTDYANDYLVCELIRCAIEIYI